jgi:hypothetical protein
MVNLGGVMLGPARRKSPSENPALRIHRSDRRTPS